MNAEPLMSPEPSLESRIFKALRDEYPSSLSAAQLMNRSGLSWRSDPVRSFTLLCISFSKLNRELLGTGWQAIRTGGTPDDHYTLQSQSSGGG